MQLLKLEVLNGCCTSQADNNTSILELCIMETNDLWKKLYHELKFEDYISCYSPKLLEKINNSLLDHGKVRNNGCENCGIIYLFHPVGESLNKSFDLQSDKVINIKDIIYSALENRPTTLEGFNEKYELPKWLNCENMPKQPIHRGRKIKHHDEKYEKYQTLLDYLKHKIDVITRRQIAELLSIKISDYDFGELPELVDFSSNKLLFQKIPASLSQVMKS